MTHACKARHEVYKFDDREIARLVYFDNGQGVVMKLDPLHMWTPDQLRSLADGCREIADALDPVVREA